MAQKLSLVQGLMFAEDECRLELDRLEKMKKQLVEALDQIDADKPMTALKLGATISRVVAGMDWACFKLRRGKACIKELADIAAGKAKGGVEDNLVRDKEVLS